MIEIQMHGSFEARCGDYSYSHPRKSPIGPLLRKMIASGDANEDDMVVIKRGDMMEFKPAPVHVWSQWNIIDRDSGGIYRTKYVPFDRSELDGQ